MAEVNSLFNLLPLSDVNKSCRAGHLPKHTAIMRSNLSVRSQISKFLEWTIHTVSTCSCASSAEASFFRFVYQRFMCSGYTQCIHSEYTVYTSNSLQLIGNHSKLIAIRLLQAATCCYRLLQAVVSTSLRRSMDRIAKCNRRLQYEAKLGSRF